MPANDPLSPTPHTATSTRPIPAATSTSRSDPRTPRTHSGSQDPVTYINAWSPTNLLRGGRVVWLGDVAKTQCWRGRAAVEVCKAITHLVTHFLTRLGTISHASLAPILMTVECSPEL